METREFRPVRTERSASSARLGQQLRPEKGPQRLIGFRSSPIPFRYNFLIRRIGKSTRRVGELTFSGRPRNYSDASEAAKTSEATANLENQTPVSATEFWPTVSLPAAKVPKEDLQCRIRPTTYVVPHECRIEWETGATSGARLFPLSARIEGALCVSASSGCSFLERNG
jgi:hypothetical protein